MVQIRLHLTEYNKLDRFQLRLKTWWARWHKQTLWWESRNWHRLNEESCHHENNTQHYPECLLLALPHSLGERSCNDLKRSLSAFVTHAHRRLRQSSNETLQRRLCDSRLIRTDQVGADHLSLKPVFTATLKEHWPFRLTLMQESDTAVFSVVLGVSTEALNNHQYTKGLQ